MLLTACPEGGEIFRIISRANSHSIAYQLALSHLAYTARGFVPDLSLYRTLFGISRPLSRKTGKFGGMCSVDVQKQCKLRQCARLLPIAKGHVTKATDSYRRVVACHPRHKFPVRGDFLAHRELRRLWEIVKEVPVRKGKKNILLSARVRCGIQDIRERIRKRLPGRRNHINMNLYVKQSDNNRWAEEHDNRKETPESHLD